MTFQIFMSMCSSICNYEDSRKINGQNITALSTLVGHGWATVAQEGCSPCSTRWMHKHWGFFRRTQEHLLSQERIHELLTLRERLHLKVFTLKVLERLGPCIYLGWRTKKWMVHTNLKIQGWGCEFGSLQVAYLWCYLYLLFILL